VHQVYPIDSGIMSGQGKACTGAIENYANIQGVLGTNDQYGEIGCHVWS
jgi:hypothetical protein